MEVRALTEGSALLVAAGGQLLEVSVPARELLADALPEAVAALLPAPPPRRVLRLRGPADVLHVLELTLTGAADVLTQRPDDADADAAITLVVLEHLDERALRALDDESRRSGVHTGEGGVVVLWPDRGLCWSAAPDPRAEIWLADVVCRLRAAAPSAAVADALFRAPLKAASSVGTAARIALTAAAITLAGDLVTDGLGPHRGLLRCVTPGSPETHRVPPRPDAPPSRAHGHGLPLVDPVTGVLRRLTTRPPLAGLPSGFRHQHAELPRLANANPAWVTDLLAPAGVLVDSHGTGPVSTEAVQASGVAHYCGAYLGQGRHRRASWAQLAAAGEDAVDPASLELHDPALTTEPGSPLVPFDRDLEVSWLAGTRRTGTAGAAGAGSPCWVPLSLVHAGWLGATHQGVQPTTNLDNLVGLAAARTAGEAAERGAEHVIAQDAVAVWWARGSRLAPVAVPEPVAAAWGPVPVDAQVTLLDVPSTTGHPVVLAVVDDPTRDIVTAGSAAGPTSAVAAERAVVEALLQHAWARDLDSPVGLVRRATELGNGQVAGLAEHRPHRDYLAAHRGDLRDVVDPMVHVELGLDTWVVAETRRRTSPCDSRLVERRGRGTALDALVASGLGAVTVDVTTADVAASGWSAVRVVSPGAASLLPAAFPLSPSGRLERASRHLGWGVTPSPVRVYPGW